MRRVRSALVLAVLAAGCDPDLVTDSGRLGIDVALDWPPTFSPHTDTPIVAGSQWCPTLVGYFDHPGDPATYHERDLDPCFAVTLEGPATWTAPCASLDAAGELRVTMTPTECDDRQHASIPSAPETLVVDIVDPADLRGQLHANQDLFFETQLLPAAGTSFPNDWRTTPGDALLVAQGGTAYVRPGLVTSDARQAAWQGGAITGARAPGIEALSELDLEVHGEPGLRISPTLELPNSAHALGTIETVAIDAAASIDVVAGYGVAFGHPNRDGSTTWTEWISLRAVVRDRSGRPIWGMPIEWRVVDGYVALQSDQELYLIEPVPDYAMVADVCSDPPREPTRRTAIVEASVGALTDIAELEWTAVPMPPTDDPPDDELLALCEGPDAPDGCGCTAGSPRSLIWLAGLIAFLRRRAPITGMPQAAVFRSS